MPTPKPILPTDPVLRRKRLINFREVMGVSGYKHATLCEMIRDVRIPVNVTADSGDVTDIPANVTEGRCCAF